MSVDFEILPYNPFPLPDKGTLETDDKDAGANLLALDIVAKYMFVDEGGETYHEYFIPSDADINNVGGYVGKLIKYRDPTLLEFLRSAGVTPEAFRSDAFPILASRSPQLDLVLFDLILRLRRENGNSRVSLIDLGCTVAEHWDLLDVMLRAQSKGQDGAGSVLTYSGLDKSSLLLTIAHLLHAQVPPKHFKLVHAEGSQFAPAAEAYDLSLSVGVINHVAEPAQTIKTLLRATRYGAVFALWVTEEDKGFWTTIHSGLSFYVFARRDLGEIERADGRGRFYVVNYIPEVESSQERSFIGLGSERLSRMGCAHLLYSTLPAIDYPGLVI